MFPTLHKEGKLNTAQSQFMAARKPEVELYDLDKYPDEVNNLANSPEHKKRVETFRKQLDGGLKEMNDRGAIPEPPEAQTLE